MRLAICVVFLLALFGANASEKIELLNIETNGLDDETNAVLLLNVDQNSLSAHGLSLYDYDDSKTKNYNVNNLGNGVTLKKMKGRNIIQLKSTNFVPNVGGDFKLIYLNDGRFKTYKAINIRMMKISSDYRWGVFASNGRELEGLTFNVKKVLLLGAVGIDNISYTYK